MAAVPFFKSEASPSGSRWTYDVFLSFRGKDTRRNFIDNLYTALIQAGIHTFRDDIELPRGEEISSQLLKAIEESRISVVVFSKGYASSRWCLDELTKILECKNTKGQIVVPIFYDIDPSNVRHQKRSFAEAFEAHEKSFKEELEKVNKWRQALNEAANLSGWNLNDTANGYESKFIQKIVEEVSNKLVRKYLTVAKHPVGIDSRVHDIIALLSMDTADVRIVGIYGMPGMGKTTIAKAIFNQLCYGFEGSCFIFNVKEISGQPKGLVQLQEQLICDILKQNIWKIYDVDRGINLIKERLCHKRVFVVLDDVDQLQQIDALAGERSWFGSGSRIIITTRNESLLYELDVDEKYQAEPLNENESLELFSWHAFKDTRPVEDYMELTNGVIVYSGGLPLALEVLGSNLFKRSIAHWRNTIDKLQKIPNHQIQKKLRLSFESLDDDTVKNVFLDIACFFIGKNKEYVSKILDGRRFFAEIGISILVEKSLVTINHQNEINMHDLLRDMGREIIREKSPDPGNRSRIWLHEDAWDVLNKQMGTKYVEGLAVDVRASKAVHLSTKSFKKMRFLKLLQIDGVHFTGSYKSLSKELIWLCWHECPLTFLPSDFLLDNVVVIDMQYGNIKELKILNKLKILDLSYSKFTRTPNFNGLPSLQRLILECCISLVEVHQSIGHLGELVFLNLKSCCRIKNLPQSICDLKSLGTLNISMCSQLENLPERLGDMESLTELLADGSAIKEFPSSMGNLKNLRVLSLAGCSYKQDSPSTSWLSLISSWLSPRSSTSKALLPASFASLTALTTLNLSYYGLSEGAISIDMGSLSSLEALNLSGNKFVNLPSGIGRLHMLKDFFVRDCTNLLEISELPLGLEALFANNCTSMERLTIHSQTRPSLILGGCKNLIEIQGLEHVDNRWGIFSQDCNSLSNNFRKSIVQALCKGKQYDVVVAGGEIPEWFSHRGEGSLLSFQVPSVVSDGNELQALVVWVVFASQENGSPASAIIKNTRNHTRLFEKLVYLTFNTDSCNLSWVMYITLAELPYAIEGGEELELSVETKSGHVIAESCGVHFVVKEPYVETSGDNQLGSVMVPYDPRPSTDEQWISCLIRELQEYGICFASRD